MSTNHVKFVIKQLGLQKLILILHSSLINHIYSFDSKLYLIFADNLNDLLIG